MTRILLVEDEGAIAQTVEFALRADGFDTVHALTGQQALRLRRFIEASGAGKYQEAEMALGAMPMEARALAYAAGVVAAGDGAPARWRKTARLALFAPERPYLRN